MKYIIANWKENKTLDETKDWLKNFIGLLRELKHQKNQSRASTEVKIVLCLPFPFIIPIYEELRIKNYELGIKGQENDNNDRLLALGAQNISQYEGGRYTGETSVMMIKDFVDYAIVGHSERRKYFGETNKIVNEKIKLCLRHKVTPIVCVANLEQVELAVSSQQSAFDPSSGRGVVSSKILKTKHRLPTTDYRLPIIVFEPIEAISNAGGGHPDTPEHAQKMAEKIKEVAGDDAMVIYGGSVDSKNVGDFVRQKDIGGVLVGESSLDVEEFFRIIKQVYSVDAKT